VVLTLWVACAVVLTWRVTQRPRVATWVVLGLVSGLGLLTKYQFVLALAAMGLWWLHLRGWRHPIHRQGALWAAVCALAVCAPHFHWLQTQGWMPFAYARSASLGAALEGAQRVGVALEFTLDWWLNRALPAWLLLWCALGWRRSAPSPNDAATPARPGDESQVRAFLLCWAVVPWACMVLLGLGWGVALEPHWGTPFALWTVAGVLELLRRLRPLGRAPQLRRAWVAFAVIQTLLLAQFLAASPVGLPNYKASHQNRFPAQHLAQQIAPAARQALGGPIDILVGPQFLAGTSPCICPSSRACWWMVTCATARGFRPRSWPQRACWKWHLCHRPSSCSRAAGRCTSTGPGAPGKRLRRSRRWLHTPGRHPGAPVHGELALLGVARPGHAELPGVRGERRRLARLGGLGEGVQPGGQGRWAVFVHSHSAPCCCSRCGVAQGEKRGSSSSSTAAGWAVSTAAKPAIQ